MTVRFRGTWLVALALTGAMTAPAFADPVAVQDGGTAALVTAMQRPHSCTAMVRPHDQARVVCSFPDGSALQFHTTAGWVRAHMDVVPGVTGLFQSDAGE